MDFNWRHRKYSALIWSNGIDTTDDEENAKCPPLHPKSIFFRRRRRSPMMSHKSPIDHTAPSPCDRCLIEQHNREAAERTVFTLEVSCTQYQKILKRTMDELDRALELIGNMQILLRAVDDLQQEYETINVAYQDLSEAAFEFAPSIRDKAVVARMSQRSGHLPGPTVYLHSISGLPRLRVFGDEQCCVVVSIRDSLDFTLWSSPPVTVRQSTSENPCWQTVGDCGTEVQLPLGLFDLEHGSKLSLWCDSNLIAETPLMNSRAFQNSERLELSQTGVPIENSYIHLSKSREGGIQDCRDKTRRGTRDDLCTLRSG
jgi:hypothetical protein